MSSCAAKSLERKGVVYFCDTVWDLVLVTIGSFRVWIDWMVGGFAEFMLGLLRLEIGSWSSLELIFTCVCFFIGSNFCSTTPLEVMSVFFFGGHP